MCGSNSINATTTHIQIFIWRSKYRFGNVYRVGPSAVHIAHTRSLANGLAWAYESPESKCYCGDMRTKANKYPLFTKYIYFHGERKKNIEDNASICAMHNNRLINNLFLFNTHFNIFIVGLPMLWEKMHCDHVCVRFCVCRCLIKSVTSMYFTAILCVKLCVCTPINMALCVPFFFLSFGPSLVFAHENVWGYIGTNKLENIQGNW